MIRRLRKALGVGLSAPMSDVRVCSRAVCDSTCISYIFDNNKVVVDMISSGRAWDYTCSVVNISNNMHALAHVATQHHCRAVLICPQQLHSCTPDKLHGTVAHKHVLFSTIQVVKCKQEYLQSAARFDG